MPLYDLPRTKGLEWDRWARKRAKSNKDLRKEAARLEQMERKEAARLEKHGFNMKLYERPVDVFQINKKGWAQVTAAKTLKAKAREAEKGKEPWAREEKEGGGFESEDMKRLMKEAVKRDQAREARWRGKDQ